MAEEVSDVLKKKKKKKKKKKISKISEIDHLEIAGDVCINRVQEFNNIARKNTFPRKVGYAGNCLAISRSFPLPDLLVLLVVEISCRYNVFHSVNVVAATAAVAIIFDVVNLLAVFVAVSGEFSFVTVAAAAVAIAAEFSFVTVAAAVVAVDFLKAHFFFVFFCLIFFLRGKKLGRKWTFLGCLAPIFSDLYFGRRCVGILTNQKRQALFISHKKGP